MKSLALLMEDPGISSPQKQYFCQQAVELISLDLSPHEIALEALGHLWMRYDLGGISVGRSLRAALLKEITLALHTGYWSNRTKTCLSILLGMYHDHHFINSQGWYEYEIGHFSESDVLHRVWLSTAAFCLDHDEVCDMEEWNISRIVSFF